MPFLPHCRKSNVTLRAGRQLLCLLVACSAAATGRADYRIGQAEVPQPVVQSDPAAFQVHPGHPRLYFRDTDLPALRARAAGEFAAEWTEMRTHLEQRVFAQPPEKFARGIYLKGWQPGRNATFAAVLTGEAEKLTWARQWAAALLESPPARNDGELRGLLQCLAIAYDWLYPHLSDTERANLEAGLLQQIERCWYFADGTTNYIGGHSRWGNMTLATGLLALVTERPELRDRLLTVRNHWINGYFPAQGWIAAEGGYHMGWAYSLAYLSGDIHAIWSSATNETVFFPWQARLPQFWHYGRQGDGSYPNKGDAYTIRNDLNSSRTLLLIAAGVFKDPYAAAMIRPSGDRLADLLYGDKRVTPREPGNSERPLPLSRNFGAAGIVIARDQWGPGTTHLQFQSTPFYSSNHNHLEQNAFTLHYRGGLAIDSGVYDEFGQGGGGYAGPHWMNYFQRTVAHNAIVVIDPDQKYTFYERPISNDGGQVFRTEPTHLADIQPGGVAQLVGITGYRDTPEYTYMAGDATPAYDPERVRLAQRELVYLRDGSFPHPVVVVFDRVESTNASFAKRFLLHTVHQPRLHGRTMVAENAGGRLTSLTLWPRDARLELIGGPGKEAWVDGKNHLWDQSSDKVKQFEPGAWRLEVGPGRAQHRDYFLHVLFVDDADAPPVPAEAAQLLETDTGVGVRLADWEMIFPFEAGASPTIRQPD